MSLPAVFAQAQVGMPEPSRDGEVESVGVCFLAALPFLTLDYKASSESTMDGGPAVARPISDSQRVNT
ncbi:unnamed protein product [Boreogadus saida]